MYGYRCACMSIWVYEFVSICVYLGVFVCACMCVSEEWVFA